MKTILSKCVWTLVLAASVSFATAAVAGRRIRVNVPFPFVAGSARLPAGDYTVTQDDTQNVVFVTNLRTGAAVVVLPEANVIGVGNAQPSVNFVKTNNEYFMKVVHTAGGQGFSMRTAH